MNSKIFTWLTMGATGAALCACAAGGTGGIQQWAGVGGDAVGASTIMQNQMGPAERPAVASESDPATDLKLSCQPFIDEHRESEAPDECKVYWQYVSDQQNMPHVTRVENAQGQIHAVVGPATIAEPAAPAGYVIQQQDGTYLHLQPVANDFSRVIEFKAAAPSDDDDAD